VLRARGVIRNDEPETLIRDCAACLRGRAAAHHFPEGTRTVPGERLHFVRRGAPAHVALTTGVPICPWSCAAERGCRQGAKWYELPPRSSTSSSGAGLRTPAALW